MNIGKQQKERKRKKLAWAKDWLRDRNRKGAYQAILKKLKVTDFEHFRRYLGKNTDTFDAIIYLLILTLRYSEYTILC